MSPLIFGADPAPLSKSRANCRKKKLVKEKLSFFLKLSTPVLGYSLVRSTSTPAIGALVRPYPEWGLICRASSNISYSPNIFSKLPDKGRSRRYREPQLLRLTPFNNRTFSENAFYERNALRPDAAVLRKIRSALHFESLTLALCEKKPLKY